MGARLGKWVVGEHVCDSHVCDLNVFICSLNCEICADLLNKFRTASDKWVGTG